MKKRYIAPSIEIEKAQMTVVICTSLTISDGDGTPAEAKGDNSWDLWSDTDEE